MNESQKQLIIYPQQNKAQHNHVNIVLDMLYVTKRPWVHCILSCYMYCIFNLLWPINPIWDHASTLQWCHNERDGITNHRPHECLLNRLFKKTSKLSVTGLVLGIHRWSVNSPHKWPVMWKMFPFDDVIMWSILNQFMACCLMAPNHHN